MSLYSITAKVGLTNNIFTVIKFCSKINGLFTQFCEKVVKCNSCCYESAILLLPYNQDQGSQRGSG